MIQKNTKSVALTAITALLVLLVIGFGEAFAEVFDTGEWQMITLGLSELSEIYADAVIVDGQLENVTDQSNTIDRYVIDAKSAYLDVFDEVIHFQ
ncbi:MAG: hypothetical protein ACRBB2_00665 [Nitrosopumilus sp.]